MTIFPPRAGQRSGPAATAQTVLARTVSRLVDLAVAAGMHREALIEAAGLRRLDLAHPDARVPLSAEVALWQLIAKGIADPGFGIRAGASLRIREAGLLGYIMYNSATLGAALRRLVRYSRVLGEAVSLRLESPDEQHVAIVEARTALGAGLPVAVDYRLAAMVSACRQITGIAIAPQEVAFAYDPPASILEHRRFFGSLLSFAQPVTKIVFHERDLSLPIPRGDETLAGYLSDYAEHVLRSLVAGTSIRDRVRSAIWSELSEGRPTLTRVASALGIPARTLQRRLAGEGTSMQAEVEDIRKAIAVAALRTRSAPIEDVAFLLGYAEPTTFYRAFRRWTGMTPDQYRRSQG